MASITDENFLVMNQGGHPLVNFNFMLRVEALYDLPCKSIRAFSKELEYDFIQEGGLNDYVHMRRKPITKPFTLEVERYVGVDYFDPMPLGADLLLPVVLLVSRYRGQFIPFVVARTYVFTGCTVMKKTYGDLVGDQSGLLVETTTLAYRELLSVDIPWSRLGQHLLFNAPSMKEYDGSPDDLVRIKRLSQNAYDSVSQATSIVKNCNTSSKADSEKLEAAITALTTSRTKIDNQLKSERVLIPPLEEAVTAADEAATKKRKARNEAKGPFDTATADLNTAKNELDSSNATLKAAQNADSSAAWKENYFAEQIANATRLKEDADKAVADSEKALAEATEKAKDAASAPNEAETKLKAAEEAAEAAREALEKAHAARNDAEKELRDIRSNTIDVADDVEDAAKSLSNAEFELNSSIAAEVALKKDLDSKAAALEAATAAKAEAEAALPAAQAELAALTETNAEGQTVTADAAARIAAAESSVAALQATIEQSDKTLAEIAAARKAHEDQVEAIRIAQQAYDSQLSTASNAAKDKSSHDKKLETAEAKLKEKNDALAAANKAVADSLAKKRNAENVLADAKSAAALANSEKTALEAKVESLSSEADKAAESLGSFSAPYEEAKKLHSETAAALKTAEEANATAQTAVEDAQKNLDAAKTAYDSARTALEAAEKQASDARDKLNEEKDIIKQQSQLFSKHNDIINLTNATKNYSASRLKTLKNHEDKIANIVADCKDANNKVQSAETLPDAQKIFPTVQSKSSEALRSVAYAEATAASFADCLSAKDALEKETSAIIEARKAAGVSPATGSGT